MPFGVYCISCFVEAPLCRASIIASSKVLLSCIRFEEERDEKLERQTMN